MIFIHELDLISVAGLIIVLLILTIGLRRRHRQRAKRQPQQLKDATTRSIVTNGGLTALPPGGNPSTQTKTTTTTSHRSTVESRISGLPPSTSPSEDQRRPPPASPLCSGCQYSLIKCQCTIVLYRPANGASPTTDSPISGPSQRSPLWRDGGSSSIVSKSVLSSPGGATDRRSTSRERVATCRTNGAPMTDRFLTVERCRSRAGTQQLTVSGCDIDSVKSGDKGRTIETNANVIGFKSKMM